MVLVGSRTRGACTLLDPACMPEPFSKDTTLFSSLTNTLLRGSERIRASCSCSVPNTHSSATLLFAKIPRPAEGGKPTRNTSCHRLLEPIQNGTKTPAMKEKPELFERKSKRKSRESHARKNGETATSTFIIDQKVSLSPRRLPHDQLWQSNA